MLNDKLHITQECTTDLSVETLVAYLKGELSKAEIRKIELHLIDCQICSDLYDGLVLVDINNLKVIESDLNKRIEEKLMKNPPQKKGRFIMNRNIRYFAMAASFALIFGISLLLLINNISTKKDIALNSQEKSDEQPAFYLEKEKIADTNSNNTVEIEKKHSPVKYSYPMEDERIKEVISNKDEDKVNPLIEENIHEYELDDLEITKNIGIDNIKVNDQSKSESNNGIAKDEITTVHSGSVVETNEQSKRSMNKREEKRKFFDNSKKGKSNVAPYVADSDKNSLNDANLAYEIGDYKKAESEYENYLKEDQVDYNAIFNLAMSQYKLKKMPEALSTFNQIPENNRDTFTYNVLYNKAKLLIDMKKHEEAQLILNRLQNEKNQIKSESIQELKMQIDQ